MGILQHYHQATLWLVCDNKWVGRIRSWSGTFFPFLRLLEHLGESSEDFGSKHGVHDLCMASIGTFSWFHSWRVHVLVSALVSSQLPFLDCQIFEIKFENCAKLINSKRYAVCNKIKIKLLYTTQIIIFFEISSCDTKPYNSIINARTQNVILMNCE